jgi:hypothetical protein
VCSSDLGEKTDGGRLVYMSGGSGNDGREFQDMVRTKNLFGKTTGRQYAHFIQSFHAKDPITPDIALQIGKEYIASLKQWEDFQVLMAVHTNTDNIHIHYIINTVNAKTGTKWQCSRQDLKHFRSQSDELCRRYNLHVIENGNRGHQSSGEYNAFRKGVSWKAMLATDIAGCLKNSKSKADFLHRLDERGIDVDFGHKNVMFFIKTGAYGLTKDMKCGDYALRGYGDFSKENIFNHFKVNKGLLELALGDPSLLQDVLLDIGRMMFPDDHTRLQDLYLGGMELADFDRMTQEEIESYLKQKKLEQIRKKALIEWESGQEGSGAILGCIVETLKLIVDYLTDENEADFIEPDDEYEI